MTSRHLAEEIQVKKKTRRAIGRILLKGADLWARSLGKLRNSQLTLNIMKRSLLKPNMRRTETHATEQSSKPPKRKQSPAYSGRSRQWFRLDSYLRSHRSRASASAAILDFYVLCVIIITTTTTTTIIIIIIIAIIIIISIISISSIITITVYYCYCYY